MNRRNKQRYSPTRHETPRALARGSSQTSVQVVLTAVGKKQGVGAGSDYETAHAQAEAHLEGAKVKYEGVTIRSVYVLEGQTEEVGKAQPAPAVKGSGGGADYKVSERSATGLF